MRYICAFCNTKKFSSKEKSYIYASSNRATRVYVCATCHRAKVREMEAKAKESLDSGFTLGILKDKDQE